MIINPVSFCFGSIHFHRSSASKCQVPTHCCTATKLKIEFVLQVYSFVFDRLRGVKQDMIIQRVSGPSCVAILEPVVRFLIYASYRLCGEPLRLYDPCINETHLQENLSWLLDCYATGTGPHPNQEEFQALGLLYNLGGLLSFIVWICT